MVSESGTDAADGPIVQAPTVHEAIVPLEGELVRLRPAQDGDAASFGRILADPTVGRWWPAADPAAEGLELATRTDVAVWAIEVDGAIVGVVMGWENDDAEYAHAGIDLGLVAEAQGRGLGPDAVRAVARWLVSERGQHRLTIDPEAANVRAIAAYRKVGFRPVGVLRAYQRALDGSWHDGLLMDLLADELV